MYVAIICVIVLLIIWLLLRQRFRKTIGDHFPKIFVEHGHDKKECFHDNNVAPLGSPLSGGELPMDLEWWKTFDHLSEHNCYDYAFGNVKVKTRSRSQPGTITGGAIDADIPYTCELVDMRLKRDHGDALRPISYSEQCAPREYKVAMMVDPGTSPIADMLSDYHFMRQDSNGLWSHKAGQYAPNNIDGDNNLIVAPHVANRKLGAYNYKDMCGYYCVDRDAHSRFKK